MTMDIATFIHQNSKSILNRWEEAAREQMAVARGAQSLALRDHLPHVMEDIQQALSLLPEARDGREAANEAFTMRYSEQHGRHRAATRGYTVDHVLHEYMILRSVVVDEIVAAGLADQRSIEAITHVVELGSLNAVKEFVKSLEEVQHKLLGTLAHDIRTPLGVAQVALMLLKESANDLDDPEEMNEMALQGVQRAQDMLSGLLDTIVAEAGDGIMLSFERGDLAREIGQACKEAKRSYGARIVSRCPDEPVMGVFDPAALRRIFENLVSNAVRYGAQSETVNISFEEEDDRVSLTVSAPGAVVPEECRAELFDFPSVQRMKSSSEKSWGIGLAFVKLAVEGHEGTVTLESSQEKGTTFCVRFPKSSREPGKVRTSLAR